MSAKKLKLNYTIPASLAAAMQLVQELADFSAYYEIDKDILKPYLQAVAADRLRQHLIHEDRIEDQPVEREALLAGEKVPENDAEQYVLNLKTVFQYLDQTKEEADLNLARELHKMLVHKTEQAPQAGRLREQSNNLFSFIDSGTLLPDTDILQGYLEELFRLMNGKSMPGLIKAWVFYYTFVTIQPFAQRNETIAMLLCQKLLDKEKLNFYSALNLEKYLFFNKKFLVLSAPLFEEHNYLERLEADLTEYLDACIEGYVHNVADIKKHLIDLAKELLEYEGLSPRQKNSLNFWLEKAFFLHKDKMKLLTPRQHEIMLLIAKYGSLSTKELVPVFQVDRKTIQRDFNTLSELNLVDQRGGGRSLKYYLDFRIDV